MRILFLYFFITGALAVNAQQISIRVNKTNLEVARPFEISIECAAVDTNLFKKVLIDNSWCEVLQQSGFKPTNNSFKKEVLLAVYDSVPVIIQIVGFTNWQDTIKANYPSAINQVGELKPKLINSEETNNGTTGLNLRYIIILVAGIVILSLIIWLFVKWLRKNKQTKPTINLKTLDALKTAVDKNQIDHKQFYAQLHSELIKGLHKQVPAINQQLTSREIISLLKPADIVAMDKQHCIDLLTIDENILFKNEAEQKQLALKHWEFTYQFLKKLAV
jgi:hypothetical protein